MCRRCADGNEPLIEPSVFFKEKVLVNRARNSQATIHTVSTDSHYSYKELGQPLFIGNRTATIHASCSRGRVSHVLGIMPGVGRCGVAATAWVLSR